MQSIERWMYAISRVMALLGGLALVALTLITVVSITGRALNDFGLGPVPGDFELVEAGTGFAIFAFLPWCHMQRAHASVEVLTDRFGAFANRIIDVVADFLMLVVAAVIAWQHGLGTLDKYGYGEFTFILQYPVWWAYAAGLAGAVVFVLVAVYCLAASVVALATGGPPRAEGLPS